MLSRKHRTTCVGDSTRAISLIEVLSAVDTEDTPKVIGSINGIGGTSFVGPGTPPLFDYGSKETEIVRPCGYKLIRVHLGGLKYD